MIACSFTKNFIKVPFFSTSFIGRNSHKHMACMGMRLSDSILLIPIDSLQTLIFSVRQSFQINYSHFYWWSSIFCTLIIYPYNIELWNCTGVYESEPMHGWEQCLPDYFPQFGMHFGIKWVEKLYDGIFLLLIVTIIIICRRPDSWMCTHTTDAPAGCMATTGVTRLSAG